MLERWCHHSSATKLPQKRGMKAVEEPLFAWHISSPKQPWCGMEDLHTHPCLNLANQTLNSSVCGGNDTEPISSEITSLFHFKLGKPK